MDPSVALISKVGTTDGLTFFGVTERHQTVIKWLIDEVNVKSRGS